MTISYKREQFNNALARRMFDVAQHIAEDCLSSGEFCDAADMYERLMLSRNKYAASENPI